MLSFSSCSKCISHSCRVTQFILLILVQHIKRIIQGSKPWIFFLLSAIFLPLFSFRFIEETFWKSLCLKIENILIYFQLFKYILKFPKFSIFQIFFSSFPKLKKLKISAISKAIILIFSVNLPMVNITSFVTFDPKSSSYTKFHNRQNDWKGRYALAHKS